MVSDQEPRYRLVDSDGNIVGSLYGKPDGSIAIQETASGADREVALAPDGTFSAPSGDFDSVNTETLQITDSSDVKAYPDTQDNLQLTEDEFKTVPLDVIVDDNLNEISGNEWSPNESGNYLISLTAQFNSGVGSPGDRIQVGLFDQNDDIVILKPSQRVGTEINTLTITQNIRLSDSNDYKMRVRNRDSDDEVRTRDRTRTSLRISRNPID